MPCNKEIPHSTQQSIQQAIQPKQNKIAHVKQTSVRNETQKKPKEKIRSHPTNLATKKDEQPTTAKKEAFKKVVVKNAITDEMLIYEHYTGKHSPNTFTTYINEQAINPGETTELDLNTDKGITVKCSYEFKKGWVHVKKEKELPIKIDPNDESITITFSWNHDERILFEKQKKAHEKNILS